MKQAIVTKFIAPTNHRDSRIKATAAAMSKTLSWDHSLNSIENHRRAAAAIATQLKWDGVWIGAVIPNGSTVWSTESIDERCKFKVESN